MKRDYSKTDEATRTEIFDSLRKYLKDELTIEELEQLCINISEFNPYLNKDLPHVKIVKNDEDKLCKKNRNTHAYYSPKTDQIYVNDFFLSKQLYHVHRGVPINAIKPRKINCALDFNTMLMILGHEIKHYFQYNLNFDNSYGNNKYNIYVKKIYNSFISLNFDPIPDLKKIDYTIGFFNNNIDDLYFKNLNDRFVDRLQFACYLKRFHETDARISGFNYAKGMIKTLLNDPLTSKYPEVKKMLKISLKSLVLQEEKYNKDDDFEYLTIAEEFSSRIMNDILNNRVSLKDFQKMRIEESESIASMICLSSDTKKIQKVLSITSETYPRFAKDLLFYANKIYPEKMFTIDIKKAEENINKSNQSNDDINNELQL